MKTEIIIRITTNHWLDKVGTLRLERVVRIQKRMSSGWEPVLREWERLKGKIGIAFPEQDGFYFLKPTICKRTGHILAYEFQPLHVPES